ncbi:hypothetical protein KKE60_06450 [Patescibacteria group bacterium]|nr:hypothetical protein [Patescibacteria group bacterium]
MDQNALRKAWGECCAREGLLASAIPFLGRPDKTRGGLRGLVSEVLKGTAGDRKQLEEAFAKEVGDEGLPDLRLGEVILTFKGRPWYRPICGTEKPEKLVGNCLCPRCAERYQPSRGGWNREAVPVEDVRSLVIHSALWADFYSSFVYTFEETEVGGGSPHRPSFLPESAKLAA